MRERSTTSAAGWRVFLKPGWVVAVLAIIGFSYAAFSFLAPWQLNKDEDIQARNHQVEASFQLDPVPVSEIITETGLAPENEWRRVTLQGHYLGDSEVLLRMRPVSGSPAHQALTPFQTIDGHLYLINRGFRAPLEGGTPDISPPPTGEVRITGHARLPEALPPTAPMKDAGYQQVYGINPGQVSDLTGLQLADAYVQLSEDQPGVLHAIPIPKLDRGSHLSYGFQWIAFGIMAPLGLGYFIWAELRERRRLKEEKSALAAKDGAASSAAAAASATSPTPTSPATSAAPAARAASATRARSRYGEERPDYNRKFAQRNRERFQ